MLLEIANERFDLFFHVGNSFEFDLMNEVKHFIVQNIIEEDNFSLFFTLIKLNKVKIVLNVFPGYQI